MHSSKLRRLLKSSCRSKFALDATQGSYEITAVKPAGVIRSYADAWNSHDVSTFRAAFTKDVIYYNPDTYPGISGEALAEFIKKVWTAVPDG
jgi:hypothetical protein